MSPELFHTAEPSEVVDVRRFPGSRRHPQFSSDAMATWLPEHEVGYRHPESLGGRRTPGAGSPNIGLHPEQLRAYADHMRSDESVAGVAELLEMAAEESVAVMRSESVWLRCYRRVDTQTTSSTTSAWHRRCSQRRPERRSPSS